MATSTTTIYQHAVEDFIRTAEANGHSGWAMLSSSHPAIRGNHWSQLRKLYNGVLAFYRDELGNLVELRTINRCYPVVQQRDPRLPYYARLRGSGTGFVVKAEGLQEARTLAATKLGVWPSSYIVVSRMPATGVVYAN